MTHQSPTRRPSHFHSRACVSAALLRVLDALAGESQPQGAVCVGAGWLAAGQTLLTAVDAATFEQLFDSLPVADIEALVAVSHCVATRGCVGSNPTPVRLQTVASAGQERTVSAMLKVLSPCLARRVFLQTGAEPTGDPLTLPLLGALVHAHTVAGKLRHAISAVATLQPARPPGNTGLSPVVAECHCRAVAAPADVALLVPVLHAMGSTGGASAIAPAVTTLFSGHKQRVSSVLLSEESRRAFAAAALARGDLPGAEALHWGGKQVSRSRRSRSPGGVSQECTRSSCVLTLFIALGSRSGNRQRTCCKR